MMKKTVLMLSLVTVALTACGQSKQSNDTSSNNPQENQSSTTQISTSTAQTSSSEQKASEQNSDHYTPTVDNAEIALDWNGDYKGVFPCADCEGIKTELELNSDKTYELKEEYLGKGNSKELKVKGTFKFDQAQPSHIVLDQAANGRKFFIGENQIFALDMETGNRIEGPLAQHYILKKELK